MNRTTGWMAGWVGLAVCWGAAAQTNAPSAATPDARYAKLTLRNLLPLEVVIQAAVDAVPTSAVSVADWEKRMRTAAWVPRLELRSGIGQQPHRNYTVVNRSSTDAMGTTTTYRDSYATGEDPRWLNEYQLAVVWDFSQLFFRPEEIDISRLKMEAARVSMERDSVVSDVRERVLLAYYDLVEALRMLEMDVYRTSVPTLIRKERAAAMVDDLAGGCLLRHLNGPARADRK
jgi:hypothetical protein